MKEFIIIISSTWKFAATFPVAVYLFKMSFVETILYTNIGGLIGIVFFMFSSKGVISLYETLMHQNRSSKKKLKKIFTKKNRRLVMIRKKYGLLGIVSLTPVLLSIPIGSFLIVKYYGEVKKAFLYLMISNAAWSLAYTLIYMKVRAAI